MRKAERKQKRIVCVFALIFIMGSVLHAQTDNLMLALSIQQADEGTLQEMARLRDITAADVKDLRQQLLAYHNLDVASIPLQEGKDRQYEMTILHADELSTDGASSLVQLQGNVVISFKLEGESKEKRLSAQKMLIDLEHTMLSAQGSVSYEDPTIDSALQDVDASIITLDWSNSTLFIRGATTQSEKTNSEDQKITLFTSGTQITYDGNASSLLYTDGWIGTRKEESLSSIRAKQLMFLPGGDLMVHRASLHVGRVPVFWTPFFLFPGNRMTGNPAMGFASERGMFVSTSFELFGTNPKLSESEKSSFASLLSASNSQALFPDGILYTPRERETGFQSWARLSGSYLTFLADAYELAGLHTGLTGHISLFEKKLSIDIHDSLALYADGKDVLAAYSDVPVYRYYGEHTLKLDTNLLDVRLDLPYYSDPKVKRLYANRLSMFSFDAPLGKAQEFPTDFNNDITSYTWKLAGSFSLPKTALFPYLNSLNISNLSAQAKWDWQKEDSTYSYVLKNVVIPELQANISGSLLSLSSPIEAKKAEKVQTASLELPPLVPKAYETGLSDAQKSKVGANRNLSFTYSIDQKLTHSLTATTTALDWEDDAYLYSFTKGSFVLSASPHTHMLKLTQEIIPQVSVVEDQSKNVFYNQEVQLFSVTKAELPALGLSYTLSQRLYRLQETQTRTSINPVTVIVDTKEEEYAFTKDTVTVHQLKFERAVPLGNGMLTPSVTAGLYPVTQSLLPMLSYKNGPFLLSASYRWTEQDQVLKKDAMFGQVRYTLTAFTFQVDANYDLKGNPIRTRDALSVKQSMSTSLFTNKVKLSQIVSYQGLTTKNIQDWIENLTFKAEIPSVALTYVMQGQVGTLEPQKLSATISAKQLSFRLWKRRIEFRLGLDASFNFHFQDRYASSLDVVGSVGFSIAEFLDCNLSVKSSNTGFFRYYDDQGLFSFPLLWEDLLRSFDMSGNGRYHTQFNLSSISFDLVHYLGDWSLNCKYTGSVVLSNNQYNWVPTVSVFLTWNTIPELNVEEKWTQSNQEWIRTQAT